MLKQACRRVKNQNDILLSHARATDRLWDSQQMLSPQWWRLPGSGSHVLIHPSCSGSTPWKPKQGPQAEMNVFSQPASTQLNILCSYFHCWKWTFTATFCAAEWVCKYSTMSCPSGGRLSTSPRSIWAFCTACILVLMVPTRACCAELCTQYKKWRIGWHFKLTYSLLGKYNKVQY